MVTGRGREMVVDAEYNRIATLIHLRSTNSFLECRLDMILPHPIPSLQRTHQNLEGKFPLVGFVLGHLL